MTRIAPASGAMSGVQAVDWVSILLDWKVILLLVFVSSGLFVHFRGKVRFQLFRQLTNFSTFLAPYSALMYLFSKVPTKPILDARKDFPELTPLRENWRVIRDEAKALYDAGSIGHSENYSDVAFNSFFKRGWRRFYLKYYGDFLPSARQLCPRTVELVDAIPSVKAAVFTLLAPQSKLPEHRDPFAGSLRYHLGLVTPNSDDCHIIVDGNFYSWRDGEDLVFDETYIHRAQNDTDQTRIILFCDVQRPINNPVIGAVNHVFTWLAKGFASNNEQREQIGAVNRISGPLYGLRRMAKRLKKTHRNVYYGLAYTLKLLFLGSVLYLVFWR